MYSQKIIDKILKNRERGLSYSQCTSCVSGLSKGTVWNWSHKEMSQDSVKERLKNRGRPPKVPERLLTRIKEFVMECHLNCRECSAKDIIQFFQKISREDPDPRMAEITLKKWDVSRLIKKLDVRLLPLDVSPLSTNHTFYLLFVRCWTLLKISHTFQKLFRVKMGTKYCSIFPSNNIWLVLRYTSIQFGRIPPPSL